MGWTGIKDGSRKDVIAECLERGPSIKLVRHALRGNVLWTIDELCIDNGDFKRGDRFIGCYLLRPERGYGWAYKPMDESVGPYYYTCPASFLRDAPCMFPVGSWAHEWRLKVAERQATASANRRSKRAYLQRCACADPGCAAHPNASECRQRAITTLVRIDFAGRPRVRFCAHCAADALESEARRRARE